MTGPSVSVNRVIGARLRRQRLGLGLTLAEVCQRVEERGISVSVATLHRAETGQSSLGLGVASAVCRTLGLSIGEIEEVIHAESLREAQQLSHLDTGELLDRAQSHAERGAYPRALACFEAAAGDLRARSAGRKRDEDLARVLISIAVCHHKLRHYRLALEHAGRVLQLQRPAADCILRALLLHVGVYGVTGEYVRGQLFADRVVSALPDSPPATRAFGYAMLGGFDNMRNAHDSAVEHLERARGLYEDLGNDREVARTMITLAASLHEMQQTDRALELTSQAYQRAREGAFDDVARRALVHRGHMLIHREQWQPARASFEQAARFARRLGLHNELFIAWHGLWSVALATHDAVEGKKARTVLGRMLRRVDPELPQAREYVAYERKIEREEADEKPPTDH